jgi:hypothetical protein
MKEEAPPLYPELSLFPTFDAHLTLFLKVIGSLVRSTMICPTRRGSLFDQPLNRRKICAKVVFNCQPIYELRLTFLSIQEDRVSIC